MTRIIIAGNADKAAALARFSPIDSLKIFKTLLNLKYIIANRL
jgi:hypothetical protein